MQKQKTLYYLPTYGQLGNQLATLAHLLSFAVEYGYTVVYPKSDYFSKHLLLFQTKQNSVVFSEKFSNPKFIYAAIKLLKLLFFNRNVNAFKYLVVNRKFVVETEFNITSQPNIIIVTDWLFRFYDGVKKHQDLLRQQLSFTQTSIAKAQNKWLAWQKEYPFYTFIGIHVRRGDYAEWLGGKYFYDDATYYSWITQLSQAINNAVFIICSNEELCFINKNNLTIIYANGSPPEDLFLLSHCRYIVGPPSTFSSWSAFLGNCYLYQPATKDEQMQLKLFDKYYL